MKASRESFTTLTQGFYLFSYYFFNLGLIFLLKCVYGSCWLLWLQRKLHIIWYSCILGNVGFRCLWLHKEFQKKQNRRYHVFYSTHPFLRCCLHYPQCHWVTSLFQITCSRHTQTLRTNSIRDKERNVLVSRFKAAANDYSNYWLLIN